MIMVPHEVIKRRLTFADYKKLPNDQDYEIVEGVLYVSPRPRAKHQIVAAELVFLLLQHVRHRGLGLVVPDADLVIRDRDIYISPDIMVFLGERASSVPLDGWIRTVPDLVVEVLSPSTSDYDLTTKRRIYAELGVRHYWLADVAGRALIECVLGSDGHYRERTVEAPADFSPDLFPELRIDLGRIFA
jgi:Uma2 family endonuclease